MKWNYLLIIMLIFIVGCSASDYSDDSQYLNEGDDHVDAEPVYAEPIYDEPQQVIEERAENLNLETLNDPGIFSIDIPQGWDIYTGGQCTTGAILLQDPNDELRQVMYFSSIGPFYVSDNQKQIDENYMSTGGYPIEWFEMPVVNPLTPEEFIKQFPLIVQTDLFSSRMQAPNFWNPEILSVEKTNSEFPGESALVRVLFTDPQKTRVCEGLFHVTINQVVPELGGPGSGIAWAYQFVGITADGEDFEELEPQLIQSLQSLQVADEYANSCTEQINEIGRSALRAGQILSEASDIITDGWEARQKTDDIISAKRSDATLGIERLKDPSTGDVYHVEQGTYDDYLQHPNNYKLPDLEPLADNDYDGWTAATLNQDHVTG